MAQRNSTTKSTASTVAPKLTVAEMREKIETYEKKLDRYAATKQALQLLDLTKNETRTYTIFDRDRFRTAMQNPKQNEALLKQLVRFVYRYSQPFKRIVHYYAEMICLDAYSIIPMINKTDGYTNFDEQSILDQFVKTAMKVQNMDLHGEIFKMLLVCWLEGAAYGYIYDDYNESDGTGSFFIHLLDGEYCKVYAIENGVCRFAFDFSYFSRREEVLEFWAPEFKQKYNKYKKDMSLRWQPLELEPQICLKLDLDDLTLDLSPWLAIMENLISLIDLQSITAVKDALSIYKMLVARLETFDNNEPDDWKVDIDLALEYFNKFQNSLPTEVTAIVSPLPIEPIEFKGTTTEDEDRISISMKNLFDNSGGSAVLGSDKSGTTIFEAQVISDTEFGLSSLLPQIQKWINLYLDYALTDHAFVKYYEVSPYTRQTKKKQLLESGQNGVPDKLAIAAMDGISPLEVLSLDILENKILKLHENWIPLSTSYTQSGASGAVGQGAPTKDSDDLSDEGAKSREKK